MDFCRSQQEDRVSNERDQYKALAKKYQDALKEIANFGTNTSEPGRGLSHLNDIAKDALKGEKEIEYLIE